MQQRVILTLAITSLLLGAAACDKRTAAATQASVTAFDPAASDAQAVTAAQAVETALGGAEAWNQIKQLQWTVKHTVQGKLTEHFKHAWDIWNGRHRFEFLPPDQLEFKPQPGQTEPEWIFAMYDLFNRKGGYVASSKSPHMRADHEQAARVIDNAYNVWLRDAYWLTMFHKLRDPGVILKYAGERKDYYGTCQDGCIDIKVTFAPQVGTDEYHVLINKQTNLPEVVEKGIPGGNMGLKVLDWVEAGGVKFPSGFKNLAADEVFEYSDVRAGEPDDSLYVPEVSG